MQVPERGKGRGCEIENRPRQVDVFISVWSKKEGTARGGRDEVLRR